MLRIDQESYEDYKEETNEFFIIPEIHLELEHSLISIQKWESRWNKPFLDKKKKTKEELIDYIRCMTIKPALDPLLYWYISNNNVERIVRYIENPMSATTVTHKFDSAGVTRNEIVTAEVIYYWMFKLGIPIEVEKWHFNRLYKLLEVFDAKDNQKKLSKAEAARERMRLNAERRARYNSAG